MLAVMAQGMQMLMIRCRWSYMRNGCSHRAFGGGDNDNYHRRECCVALGYCWGERVGA